MLPAVGPDHPEVVHVLVEEDHAVRQLDDLHRIGRAVHPRDAREVAVGGRVDQVRHVVERLQALRGEWERLDRRGGVRVRSLVPETRQVGPAVGRSRNRRAVPGRHLRQHRRAVLLGGGARGKGQRCTPDRDGQEGQDARTSLGSHGRSPSVTPLSVCRVVWVPCCPTPGPSLCGPVALPTPPALAVTRRRPRRAASLAATRPSIGSENTMAAASAGPVEPRAVRRRWLPRTRFARRRPRSVRCRWCLRCAPGSRRW